VPSTVTATGKVGPGNSVTSLVYNNVKEFSIRCDDEMLFVRTSDGVVHEEEIASAATITVTVSGSTYTVDVANA
jgi:hypothetical protein